MPSHSGINENQKADKAAKETTSQNCIKLNIPSTEVKMHVIHAIEMKWTTKWENKTSNKLREIISDSQFYIPAPRSQ